MSHSGVNTTDTLVSIMMKESKREKFHSFLTSALPVLLHSWREVGVRCLIISFFTSFVNDFVGLQKELVHA